ncbi:hypothetical protein WOSG25_060820 [Weissella oryzae SG25]|uniref:DUF1048 domain-containing protein n=1 Tax=Weissella oryzae (strain DSM 25784 / JCM 18191 / LMG 30913 / SG25) TaxID=1329250 RepID=A0A069CT18_WEIOS|nr:DUF1048 domain-containing protein [Weissella oryzae]GAK30960.1 hypothetical protein WOSG25_060820 [Weissella oryzae SG25]
MNLMNTFTKQLNEKKEYRAMVKRAEKLPADYFHAFKAIQSYAFTMGTIDWHLFDDVIDLLELGAAEQKPVKMIVGDDVAAFVDELIGEDRYDWQAKYRQRLNDYFKNR